MRSLYEISEWVRTEPNPTFRRNKRYFLHAAKAIGRNSTTEEGLLRLMIWVGTLLPTKEKHSRLQHPLDILSDGSGWCDQHCAVFNYMAWNLLDIGGRPLAIYHTDGVNGHTVTEVLYGETWHLFDAHGDHQAVYRHSADRHILSYDEIVANPACVIAENHWWRGNNGVGKEGFYIEGSRACRSHPAVSLTNSMKSPWKSWLTS